VVATGLANRRSRGAGQRRGLGWRIAIRRTDERHEGAHAGAPGRYGEGRTGELPRDERTTDPFHH
jgi:hypothetical protein